MQETPPPFHSRRRTRTRPTHRRIEVDPGPDMGRFRRRLSRTSVILAAFIAIVGVGTAMGLDPRLAKLAAILVSFQTTYLLRRHIVFRAAAA